MKITEREYVNDRIARCSVVMLCCLQLLSCSGELRMTDELPSKLRNNKIEFTTLDTGERMYSTEFDSSSLGVEELAFWFRSRGYAISDSDWEPPLHGYKANEGLRFSLYINNRRAILEILHFPDK